jgi:hypothetical protein
MLREILVLLASGTVRSPDAIALELGLSESEMDDMLTRLCSLGYVEEFSSAMASSCRDDSLKACAGCAGCSAGACFPASKSRLWALSPKGRKSLSARDVLDAGFPSFPIR